MAKSDNRHIIGANNDWFGDCDNDTSVKVNLKLKFNKTAPLSATSDNPFRFFLTPIDSRVHTIDSIILA